MRTSILVVSVNIIFFVFAMQGLAVGIAGNAILFDGIDDFVRIPDAPHLEGMTTITIEAWFCPLNSQGINPIFWKSDGGDVYTDRSYELQLPNSHNQAYVSFFSGTSGWTELCESEIQLMTNQWIHVVTTYDSINGIAQLYMNGQLAVSVNRQAGGELISDAIRNSNQDLLLGAAFGKYLQEGSFTYGLLDEVRMWNYARSESQIAQNFNRLVNPAENGLIGYWNFDESLDSQYVDDLSLYHNNGIIEGAIRVPSTVQIVPEPATLLLFGIGGLLISKRKS